MEKGTLTLFKELEMILGWHFDEEVRCDALEVIGALKEEFEYMESQAESVKYDDRWVG